MSPSNDYGDEMSRGKPTDSNIERLLRQDGSGVSDDDLRRFIASLSVPEQPPRDVPTMATALAATARAARPEVSRTGFRRLAILASAGALVMVLGGVALASDSSVPGDALYGIDRALEAIGVGNGGVDERIIEFDALVADGADDKAYSMLAGVIETADRADSEKAQRHLELAATKTNTSAQSAQEKVAALQDYIEKNKDDGVGDDGKDFGQEVASIAKSKGESEADESSGEDAPTESIEPEGQPGNSTNAPGQRKDESSQSDPADSGEQASERAGNSANAPGQQEGDGTQSDPSDSGVQPAEQPGNSANAPGQQKDK